jgi:hypothetical protein
MDILRLLAGWIFRHARWLIVAAITLAVGGVTAIVVVTDHTGAIVEGCPSGFVCIYPQNASWNNGNPSGVYFRYGVYYLSNQIGTHRILNNQYGGATVRICGDDNTKCHRVLLASRYLDVDLTSVKSIVLVEP